MLTAALPHKTSNNRLLAITQAGLLTGTLDIVSAFIFFYIKTRSNPLKVLKFIASGIFGKDANSGGNSMMIIGLLLHYCIAFAFTSFFFLLYPLVKRLAVNKVITGILYGIFIWCVMNLVVVPLSNIPPRPFNPINSLINASILIICIGIPLSLMADLFYNKRENPAKD